jgi:putative ABC transport system permease protein
MFRNILAATLANLARNRLYAAISIGGLAVGMAAALLIGLYVRDELSFDRFIPGHEKVLVLAGTMMLPGRAPMSMSDVPTRAAAWLRSDFPEVEGVARLFFDPFTSVRRGDAEALEVAAWTDPDLFRMLPMPALAGDPAAALKQPDGLVLTRSLARKYFGRDAPLGETLQLNRSLVLRVGAILQDPPANANLKATLYASNLNAASPARAIDATPYPRGDYWSDGQVYLRFTSPEAAARVKAALPAFSIRRLAYSDGKFIAGLSAVLFLVPLDGLHLYPFSKDSRGSRQVLGALTLIGGLILLSAGINFVNLTTARSTRRGVEVGVRKAAGADRRGLALQFIGEAVIYAFLALVLAVAMLELMLPWARALLDRPLAFDCRRDPGLLATVLGSTLLIGILAGAYPALVQSSFRPVQALKGGRAPAGGASVSREVLVVVQFAILVGLMLGAAVVASQTRYLLGQGLGIDKEQMVMMNVGGSSTPPNPSKPLCRDSFVELVRAMPGVSGAACSSSLAFDLGQFTTSATLPDGRTPSLWLSYVDHGFFELYGLKPIAGRFFSPSHPADEASPESKTVVINETAARTLGYASPAEAVGQALKVEATAPSAPQIVGVVPDFAFDVMGKAARPMIYLVSASWLDQLSIKLRPGQVPQTLLAIDETWKRVGRPRPVQRRFVNEHVQQIYQSTIRQGWLIDLPATIGAGIAALGLFGLAAFSAERRTKEIGIRKAMGASSLDIVRLLLWSFTRPVLWANLIAWPVAGWAMSRWLEGFARHVPLSPLYFLAAGGAALAISALTVSAQAVRVARSKPVGALRYE